MTEEAAKETKQEPLRSVHTKNFPEILKRLGISLLVSTYQAGKLILLREDNGILNTHFRTFKQPMGIAAAGNRLAVGCKTEIWELRNIPAVTRKLEQPGKHDAFYMPRQMYVTGNIDVHETAWGKDGRLRFVNTTFMKPHGEKTGVCGSSTPAFPACVRLTRNTVLSRSGNRISSLP